MRQAIQNIVLLLTIGILMWPMSAQAQDVGSVKRQMIQQSIQNYSGNCPCPYNRASNGSQCGGRSAWSRPGGRSPLCYAGDITDAMVQSWLARNNMRVARPTPVDTDPTRENIRQAQVELNRLGCDAGTPDGIIGRKSREALRSYASATGAEFRVELLRSQLFVRRLKEVSDPVCR